MKAYRIFLAVVVALRSCVVREALLACPVSALVKMTLSFFATIELPLDCSKPFMPIYLENPRAFLEDWLSGSLNHIVSGALVPQRDPHTGAIIGPRVRVTWIKENDTII